ncbi:hypothetical protein [Thioalkalivibrio sp. ALE11]|uniref:hypothetical protein n=1 Tax=Thioalkalivibrio sp. ALE11 TaxID=1265494 RepID=UPI00036BB22D|nr:hypothetical protein [Thioalkalivibrio sp. ALE11]
MVSTQPTVELPVAGAAALEAAFAAARAAGAPVGLPAAGDAPQLDGDRARWVLERGNAAEPGAIASGPGTPEALGRLAARWQAWHPAEALPQDGVWRRGVLQQQLRERTEDLSATLDEQAREQLNRELHHQGLYRFEDLPVAGSFWRSVRRHGEHTGLADLTVPPAPVPAFWQLARIALAVAVSETGELDRERYRALLDGYHRERPLSAIERGAAPTLLRMAALDDWLECIEAGHAPAGPDPRLAGLQDAGTRVQSVWVRPAA